MMQEKIIKYIEEELASEEIDGGLEVTEDLLGSGILDSLGMMKLIAFLEEEFACKVLPEEMVIENFMTVAHMNDYLESKLVPEQ
jgi:acyl carrier protein